MNDRQIVSRKIEGLTPALVRQWLSERLANCYRIAAGKTGRDCEGWLEDAAYFAAAMGMIEWSELERLEGTPALTSTERTMFKCDCPHEVRGGCSEPKCPHYAPPRTAVTSTDRCEGDRS